MKSLIHTYIMFEHETYTYMYTYAACKDTGQPHMKTETMSKLPCMFSFKSFTLLVSLTLRKQSPGYSPSLTLTAELKCT